LDSVLWDGAVPRSFPTVFRSIIVEALKTITITVDVPNIDLRLSEALGSVTGGRSLADLHGYLGSIHDRLGLETNAWLGSIHARLSDVRGTVTVPGVATEASLGSIYSRLHDIKGTVEVPGVASEATLGSVLAKLDDVRGSIAVTNLPTEYPDTVAQAWLGSIHISSHHKPANRLPRCHNPFLVRKRLQQVARHKGIGGGNQHSYGLLERIRLSKHT